MANLPVLIVGAGPTGLNLALSLARRGIQFKLISDGSGPGEHSRAMVVQARTLEFYDQLGFADEVVEQGIKVDSAHLREGGAEITSFHFKDLGDGLSPFPFPLAYPQDDHERFLVKKLEASGGVVEWRSKLTGFIQDENGVTATVLRDGQAQEIRADYICGCDGVHSCVRQGMQAGFPGGTYDQLFYVADVRIAGGYQPDLIFNLGKRILTIMFPVRSNGMQRLIGLVPPELSNRRDLTFEDIRNQIEPLLAVEVAELNWFSTYRVHHRVADHFRVGRAFILGDAGHVHSPAGGQGMNTGIGDAVNLGWKLADVLKGRAAASLLDTYEPERIGFARTLVATTDRAFTPMVADGFIGEMVRKLLAPLVVNVATRFALSRHAMFSVVSQIRIHYPDSALSEGQAGDVHGGDRLPWVQSDETDNFAPLRSLDWQVHVYGEIRTAFKAVCDELGLAVHIFPWTGAAQHAGLERDAAYLIRPDGHVALASSEQSVTTLQAFCERLGLRFKS